MSPGKREVGFLVLFLLLASPAALAVDPMDRADPLDCENPLVVQARPEQVLSLAKNALSNAKSPRHQREVALGTLIQLQKSLQDKTPQEFSPETRALFDDEIFDAFFEYFPDLCLTQTVPFRSDMVAKAHGSRLRGLLTLYKKLADNPDDTSVAATLQDRYRVRVGLESLLLDIGKYHGWKDMAFETEIPSEAQDWFYRFYAIREKWGDNEPDEALAAATTGAEAKVGSNPFKQFPTVREALEHIDQQTEFELDKQISALFGTSLPQKNFRNFVDQSWNSWAKLLGLSITGMPTQVERSAVTELWTFRTAYFMNVGSLIMQNYLKDLVPQVDEILAKHFPRTGGKGHGFYEMLHNAPENLYGNFEWIWQIRDADSQNRLLLIELYDLLSPALRTISIYRHVLEKLSAQWADGEASSSDHFYLSFEETRSFFRNSSVSHFKGLLLTLRSTRPEASPFQKVLKDLLK